MVQVGRGNGDRGRQVIEERAGDNAGAFGRLEYMSGVECGEPLRDAVNERLENERAQIPVIKSGNCPCKRRVYRQ